jgi:hypothetical protein
LCATAVGTTPLFVGVPPAKATPSFWGMEASASCQKKGALMRKLMLAALGAGSILLSAPAMAQELPLAGGDYWDVTSVKIDDGHFGDYADFLAGQFRRSNEFAKSKGWIKAYYVFSNVNNRADEPDLYLVTVTDHVPTPAEVIARNKEMNAFLQTDDRKQIAGSGQRATYRHITADMLLQQMVFTH